jgi:hypothetical protein
MAKTTKKTLKCSKGSSKNCKKSFNREKAKSSRSSDSQYLNFSELKNSTLKSTLKGAFSEAKDSFSLLRDGKIDKKEFTKRVTVSGVKDGMESAIKVASTNLIEKGLKKGAEKLGKESLKKITNSNSITTVAFGITEQIWNTTLLATGKMDKEEYKKSSKKNLATTGGAVVGAEIGAVVGSIVPIIGTGIGMFVGGMIGSIVGEKIVD